MNQATTVIKLLKSVRKAPWTKSPRWGPRPFTGGASHLFGGPRAFTGWVPRKVAWPPRGFTPRTFTA